jgi:hypothetical protein
MILHALDAKDAHGSFKPLTVRLALWEAMTTALTGPGTSLEISGAINAQGDAVILKNLQIVAAQITPKNWKLFTERTPDKLTLYRWS